MNVADESFKDGTLDYELLLDPEPERNGRKLIIKKDIALDGLVPEAIKEFQKKGRIMELPFNKEGKPLIITRNGRIYPDKARKGEITQYKRFYEYINNGRLEYYPRHPSENPYNSLKQR